jgi:hypothetical protein
MQALSVDAALLRSPRERRLCGFVHSVFDRVVNVAGNRGELFTLASRDLDNAPGTLIADTASFGATGIARGDRVEAARERIDIGGRIGIRLDGARAWDCTLPGYPADDSLLRRNLCTVRARMASRGIGRVSPPGEVPSGFGLEMAAALERLAGTLGAALRAGDIRTAVLQGKSMLGLGPGLTPSGDDFLVGLSAVLHVPGNPRRELADVCALILAGMERRTNAISFAALKAAARGRVGEAIQNLLGDLMAGTPNDLAASAARVLRIGSTSGADIVAGILCGFDVTTGGSGAR